MSRLCLALQLAAVAASNVAVLTDRTFEPAVLSDPDKMWIVYFYAPWCGHCKRLAPIFEEVAGAKEVAGIHFGKVDATEYKTLSKQFNVTGFPSVHVLHEGRKWEHKGGRTRDGLIGVLNRLREPAVKELGAEDDLEQLRKSGNDGVAFVLGLADGAHPAEAAFKDVARTRQHLDRFGSTAAADVLGAVSATPPPFVAKVAPGEDATLLPSLDVTSDALTAWLLENRFPQCATLDRHNFFEISAAGKPLLVLLLDPRKFCDAAAEGADCEKRELQEADTQVGVGAAMKALSREPELQKQVRFGILDGRKWAEFADEHTIDVESMPRLMLIDHKAKSYSVDAPGDAADAQSVRDFAQRALAGKVRVDYEDYRGLPDRWWRKAVGYVPPLASLGFLPRYTFSTLSVCLILFLIYLIATQEHPDDGYKPRSHRD